MPEVPKDLSALGRVDRPPALFLDVDGTLIEIAGRPDDVVVPSDLPPLLDRMERALDGALALISGRAVADLDRLFHPLKLPAGGQHGLEMRTASGQSVETATGSGELADIEAALRLFVESTPGTLLESKGMTVALHFRNAPEREPDARAAAEALMARHGERFQVQEGKMVLEFKPRGVDKGTAVETFLADAPFLGRMPVFIGDDVTDEHGFAAVNRMGGLSIRVGGREPTAALYRTPSVSTLKAWLTEFADALDGSRLR